MHESPRDTALVAVQFFLMLLLAGAYILDPSLAMHGIPLFTKWGAVAAAVVFGVAFPVMRAICTRNWRLYERAQP